MAISIRFTEDDLTAIDAALTQLEQRFSRLVALDAKERRRLYKMGNKTEKFCREALTVLDKNRQLASPAMDLNGALSALRTIDELRPRTPGLHRHGRARRPAWPDRHAADVGGALQEAYPGRQRRRQRGRGGLTPRE